MFAGFQWFNRFPRDNFFSGKAINKFSKPLLCNAKTPEETRCANTNACDSEGFSNFVEENVIDTNNFYAADINDLFVKKLARQEIVFMNKRRFEFFEGNIEEQGNRNSVA